jgi:hypothetical protein
MRRFLSAGALAFALAWVGDAHADEQAQHYLERGVRFYDTQDYAAASEEFKACYRLAKDRRCLYAHAQAERKRGNCRVALEAYKAFLRAEPPSSEADKARIQIAECEAQLAAEPPRAPVAKRVAKKRPVRKPPEPERRMWHEDPLGHVLAGLGLSAVATGALFAVLGEQAARRVAGSATLDEYDVNADEAERYRVGALACVVGGAVLIGVSIVRFSTYGSAAPVNHAVRLSLPF